MRSTGMVGISRLVLHRRERAVLLKSRDNGIELWTLRYGADVRDPGELFRDIREAEPDPALLDLVSQLIAERKKHWSPEMVRDPVQERLVEIINDKRKNVPPARPKAAPAPAPSNVVNIMDALRRSVAAEAKGKKGKPRS